MWRQPPSKRRLKRASSFVYATPKRTQAQSNATGLFLWLSQISHRPRPLAIPKYSETMSAERKRYPAPATERREMLTAWVRRLFSPTSVNQLIKRTYHPAGVSMAGRSKEDPRTVRNRLIFEDATAWIGRIFATMIFMIGPGAGGLWLDKQFGTRFLAPIGVVIGMALGMTALLVLVNVKRPGLKDGAGDNLDSTSPDRNDDASKR